MAAWVLLSAGGGGLHLSGFHAKNVYPSKKFRGVKAAGISAAFGASSLVFLTWLVMSDLGANFAVMASVHTAIATLLLFVNIRCQPWRVGKPGEFVDIRNQTLFGGTSEDIDRRRVLTRQPPRFDGFRTVLRKMVLTKKYLLLIFWFSCNLLLQTHYLSSIFYTLYTLGDASLTTQYYKTNLKVSDWRDYVSSINLYLCAFVSTRHRITLLLISRYSSRQLLSSTDVDFCGFRWSSVPWCTSIGRPGLRWLF